MTGEIERFIRTESVTNHEGVLMIENEAGERSNHSDRAFRWNVFKDRSREGDWTHLMEIHFEHAGIIRLCFKTERDQLRASSALVEFQS